MQRWSITCGPPPRTRSAWVGQARRQARQERHFPALTSSEGRPPTRADSGRRKMVERTRVPLPGSDWSSKRSLLRRMLGSPIPAPKPRARASSEAVE